jgi:ABC-type glycerol-3-phosphate transport system substrate-binding protein
MLTLYPEFEARTGMKLNFTQLQETPLRSKTGLELAAPSTDIDVIMMDFTFVAKYSAAGYLEPLDDHLAKIPSYRSTDFIQAFLDGCSYEGKLYAVPINQDCSIMMYRADIFKELNLNVPKTFADLEDVCKKIKAAHPEMSAIAMRGARGAGINEWTWPSFLWGFGGQYYDFNTFKATLNTPASIEAMEYYARLLKNYGPTGAANYSYIEAQTDLMQGNTAILIDSASLAPRCEDPVNSKVAGKLSYDVVPGLPGKEQPGFYAWTLASK